MTIYEVIELKMNATLSITDERLRREVDEDIDVLVRAIYEHAAVICEGYGLDSDAVARCVHLLRNAKNAAT